MHNEGPRLLRICILLGLAMLASACGRSGFQYIEDADNGVYAKIPDDWAVRSEGVIDFRLTGEDGQLSILPGDDVLPWQASFDAEAPNRVAGRDHVAGAIEVQPVDRRLRSSMSIEALIGFDPDQPDDDIIIFHQADVSQGELDGIRLIYETSFSGSPTMVDRLMLSDDRFTAVYEIRLFCDVDCFSQNASVIDEIMETFTVEVG